MRADAYGSRRPAGAHPRPVKRRDPLARLMAFVVESAGCWEFTGRRRADGYGQFWYDGRVRSAHRVAYELLVGPIADGLQIDHLCRNRGCVNPAHMEPVTQTVNVLRGVGPTAQNARRTHCSHGHELTPENVYSINGRWRHCRTCAAHYSREQVAIRTRRNAERRAARAAA